MVAVDVPVIRVLVDEAILTIFPKLCSPTEVVRSLTERLENEIL